MTSESNFEPIDVERLLGDCPLADVEYYESVGSTHDIAHQRAREENVRLPLLVVAENQTSGRGRGQNRWWTGGGSLAFSLVFDPADWSLTRDLQPQRALAVGVAIIETARPLIPSLRVGLHWPNDVFVDGRKIAGILVDVLSGGRHVVGIGLNVNNSLAGAPPEVASRAASLRDLSGEVFDRTALLCRLIVQLRTTLQAAAVDPEGFGEQFQTLCLQVGQELEIDVAGQRTTGLCEGIHPDGALVLNVAGTPKRFYSGALVH